MIRLTKPYFGKEELAAIASVLSSGHLSRGPKIAEFEAAVAGYLDVKHAIAVSSGTAALHLSVLALGLGAGDEVIVPDFTFPATANAVALAGADPVLCDVGLESFNIDPEEISTLVTSRTKAIMVVHQFGLAADMDRIGRVAEDKGLWLIEDAACALGATYHGRKCGTFGKLACFSFHPRKITTTGEGGMVATNDDQIGRQVRALRDHGLADGDFLFPGFNYRMSDLNAALGSVQQSRIDFLIEQRRNLAALYASRLAGIEAIALPGDFQGSKHTFQSYVVRLARNVERTRFLNYLRESEIESTIGTYAVHCVRYYEARKSLAPRSLMRSAEAYSQTVTLPLFPGMTADEVNYVCDKIIAYLGL